MDTKEIQTILTQIGINIGKVDGIIGVKTIGGIKEFQQIFGLASDGIAGEKTVEILNKAKEITHFKVKEFACRHCRVVKLDIELLIKLEELRVAIGDKPIISNSGYRCPTHNKNVGGAKQSLHMFGKASDIRVNGVTPSQVREKADKVFHDGGVLIYNTFVHVDTRGKKQRSDFRTK